MKIDSTMKKKKFFFKQQLLVLMAVLCLASCKKDDENYLGTLEVQIALKEGLKNISIADLTISVLNTVDNTKVEGQSDSTGNYVFLDLPAGLYNITVSETREEANYALSGSVTGIQVKRQEVSAETLTLDAVEPNAGLVIKEVYYGGAADGYASLFKDQFIEIFNNSAEVIFADGLYIANLYGETGNASSKHPITEELDISKYVYADFIDQIPGDGTQFPVQPGSSIVIALNAVNFKEGNPKEAFAVDNTGADLERYSVDWRENQGLTGNAYFDLENPAVPNMINIYMNNGLWLFDLYGTSVVIFRQDNAFTENDIVTYVKEGTTSEVFLTKISVDTILDGAEFLENSGAAAYKRIPTTVDSGFNFLKADGGAFYSSMSMQRKIDEVRSTRFGRLLLQDTNDSSVDFESIASPNQRGYDGITY
ncbi:MAG: hypothetical protein COB98_02635 [Flavobacteriaceae bacterium]|nr:MAG: hypothetical protein COB98_02635 [Flavobacteriaceae bacterium]